MGQRNADNAKYNYNENDNMEELSLLDMVKAIARRRVLFFGTFAVIGVVGIAGAFIMARTYTYTSIYALATSQMGGVSLQKPLGAVAKVQTVYLPEQMERYAEGSGEGRLRFKVKVSNPKSTTLILLKTRTSVFHSAVAKAVQNGTLRQLESADARRVAERKKELTAQIDSLNAQLDVLRGHAGNTLEIASILQNRANARQQLSSLIPGKLVALARRSIKPTGISRTLIAALALIGGLTAALLAVLVAEVGAAVRAQNGDL